MTQTLVPHRRATIAAIAIVVVTLAVLFAMNRPPICECGYVSLWYGDINSSGNSQHLSDWYTPSHIIHGMLFYGLGWLLFVKLGLGGKSAARWSFTLAIALEAAWEIVENTPMVIDRYRSVTVNFGYAGDSIINSLADLGWMSLGFYLALKLPVRVTVVLAIIMEILAAMVVRDNLTLNVIMLLWPFEAIREWQGMG
ncbi:DUF2585 domain-containing protein [Pontixanthobacter aestiaquae]|uniref:DUF2585 family protein n=1 Tax=Pontixanthobacter aestiaquae TaxID=1509367 RepID=A0A844Z741_9SPHN|nr:DUF2585 domain-containing protein [Pontixanthobacter aestiaquae]MDN3646381.1 DUF2585 domain-containing protein [Pontixanthobacter aestiaquae]MXO82630.1 DUF2585 family protein [Pontixanthobacter aestiaquae]